ncbi:RNA polymerase sigma factor [Cryobacterium sp. BB736]|uniref:RNA polymerase sigma factor n=1 Tax=Cryobacterium sp. BB736 TaxID=2746963 RepID=UPI00351CABAD
MREHSESRRARIERAVADHSPALLAYLSRRVEPSHDAADLLAETFMILWKRAASLPRSNDEVRPWMFGIARNVLLHHRRSGYRRRAVADRLRSELLTNHDSGFVDSSEYAELHAMLRELDPVDRDIIGLVHWDGFSLVEVSRILRIKEGTIRSRYHRARAQLRSRLIAGTPVVQDIRRQTRPDPRQSMATGPHVLQNEEAPA